MLRYPAKIRPDTVGYYVTFRDIPEALTAGATIEEAKEMAADALLVSMDFYFEDRRPVAMPSQAEADEVLIALPAGVSAKVLLLNEMLAQKVGPSELAKRMGIRKQEMTRIMDLSHATKIDTLASAISCLGRELDISIR
ncbi:type II toxin-antitoxin system HicB family antitoxin [Bordetella avium]|uniref:type II toxin-antitoxin system HicB family antitoxin n=1 Tax=Bordetella avium TaxID=521 RepID=UPI000E68857A|nr:type II toxin-antitoxin system HicB family antitoxin [Bordetella avium]RIQ12859.1 type II toxin-antitoxin system HicB family antitoxin [Bordetella avium]RIQ43677.1 type II toxin-antitoxin system HicB family antitoxin [Bordetella avium]RIQ53390.1 type II toxin-antitoxin system HicB family antitoxin [Bordetella avium]RIQ58182.1 type II toxin-antitoxin system HicB family antitoxin [Bordetella avium]RIQ61706.1 type II toxin-antitoxin system HicB family antitoxin [Bordetella avium]